MRRIFLLSRRTQCRLGYVLFNVFFSLLTLKIFYKHLTVYVNTVSGVSIHYINTDISCTKSHPSDYLQLFPLEVLDEDLNTNSVVIFRFDFSLFYLLLFSIMHILALSLVRDIRVNPFYASSPIYRIHIVCAGSVRLCVPSYCKIKQLTVRKDVFMRRRFLQVSSLAVLQRH